MKKVIHRDKTGKELGYWEIHKEFTRYVAYATEEEKVLSGIVSREMHKFSTNLKKKLKKYE